MQKCLIPTPHNRRWPPKIIVPPPLKSRSSVVNKHSALTQDWFTIPGCAQSLGNTELMRYFCMRRPLIPSNLHSGLGSTHMPPLDVLLGWGGAREGEHLENLMFLISAPPRPFHNSPFLGWDYSLCHHEPGSSFFVSFPLTPAVRRWRGDGGWENMCVKSIPAVVGTDAVGG